ncbi:MAG: matrixin family metalloprotease [Actinobacteria bacterium]|nr:matrixin family metalloprotease [Actinomycetota bacterium]
MALPRILVAVAIVAGLAAPATADGAQRGGQSHRAAAQKVTSPTKAPLKAASAVARRYWGAVPCNGQIKFVARSPLAPGVEPTTDAWVTFGSPMGANNLDAPASSYTNCVIAFARWRWPTSASMSEDWGMLCTTMIHEMGHLLGHSHDLTHGSVMVPVFTDSSSVPSMCRKTRPRAAR